MDRLLAIEMSRGRDWESVSRLLQVEPIRSKERDESGQHPLHWLCRESSVPLACLKMVVELYPEAVRTKSFRQALPLHLAIQNLLPLSHILLLLFNYPHATLEPNDNGLLPLQLLQQVQHITPPLYAQQVSKQLLFHLNHIQQQHDDDDDDDDQQNRHHSSITSTSSSCISCDDNNNNNNDAALYIIQEEEQQTQQHHLHNDSVQPTALTSSAASLNNNNAHDHYNISLIDERKLFKNTELLKDSIISPSKLNQIKSLPVHLEQLCTLKKKLAENIAFFNENIFPTLNSSVATPGNSDGRSSEDRVINESANYDITWVSGKLGVTFARISKIRHGAKLLKINDIRSKGLVLGINKVRLGDILIGVNGYNMEDRKFKEVMMYLQTVQKPVVLRLRRNIMTVTATGTVSTRNSISNSLNRLSLRRSTDSYSESGLMDFNLSEVLGDGYDDDGKNCHPGNKGLHSRNSTFESGDFTMSNLSVRQSLRNTTCSLPSTMPGRINWNDSFAFGSDGNSCLEVDSEEMLHKLEEQEMMNSRLRDIINQTLSHCHLLQQYQHQQSTLSSFKIYNSSTNPKDYAKQQELQPEHEISPKFIKHENTSSSCDEIPTIEIVQPTTAL